MGVAGMVMSSGYDALWYPVCYACGYLFLLLFIAGPLRRFGAYTIPDFAEGRFDSPVFRKIAVVFVLVIGFFYTMPQMKGAGTTLAYIFPGMPYWGGVVLVGAVITLNVALGGMKGITLVQAFQYWAKMFAISVPIFVLMTVYGHYGKQLETQESVFSNEAHSPIITDLQSSATNTSPGLTKLINRKPLPGKAPADPAWLNPFGPLTTKAAKAAAAALTNRITAPSIPLRADLLPTDRMTVTLSGITVTQSLAIYADITGRQLLPRTNGVAERLDDALNGRLSQLNLVKRAPESDSGVRVHRDGYFTPGEVKETVETFFKTNGLALAPEGERYFRVVHRSETPAAKTSPQAWLAEHERPLALLYTYSLIIALVCGTAGLPHILVRFYTNPDGVAAKRTTMWVMILIGVFYLFPPVFGVLGRNLMPELYAGVGAKGTDKIVLELPRILNERTSVLGSILSGITCAGAFAAFMSTFSGLLVSMTGALAHDVYGRMLNPKSTPPQQLRAFRIAAVLIGGIAIVIGTQVEPLQINFMVGQAFAIAAASYFPLLFMAVWWRKLTMKGAASGMLTGGLLALIGITLTSFSDLGLLRLAGFWAAHPLLRILCEQPAIWTVPLAIGLMIVVSNLTQEAVPADIRMKMLVLHAPEKLGLKQEYIQEHQTH
jgi:Na+(H+)/acetate symporter ActP